MNISLDRFRGVCRCGKEHNMQTRAAVIEPGAVNRLREVVLGLGLSGKGCVVCDSNTERYADQAIAGLSGLLSARKAKITLDPDHLHADEVATAGVDAALPSDAGWLLAAGSGTIHDITRYVAGKRGMEFVAFPTAASVDGFLSSTCAMTWYGFKKTMPGISPIAFVADTDIFSKAPYHLTASGIGDVLGKYTALADWEIANLITGEAFCPAITEITREAVDKVRAGMEAIQAGDTGVYEQLMYAQALSGIAMQMWDTSRPASSAEHHLSHLWEMEVINPHIDALHGEKVGVGELICLGKYAEFAEVEDIAPHLVPYGGIPHERLREVFGELYDSLMEENGKDILLEAEPARVLEQWPKVRAILRRLPDPAALREAMKKAGLKASMEDLRLDPAILEDSMELAPYVRRRMSMLRLRKMTNL